MDRTRETYFQGGESLRKEGRVKKSCVWGWGEVGRHSRQGRKPHVKIQVQEGECSRDTGLALWLRQWLVSSWHSPSDHLSHWKASGLLCSIERSQSQLSPLRV